MKVKEFILKKREEEGGPRDFILSGKAYNKFLQPISEEFKKYSVEMREIIFFSILLSANHKNDVNTNQNIKFNNDRENDSKESPKSVFSIIDLDTGKFEFLLSIMINLYGVESILNYKDMMRKLVQLAEDGLELLYYKFSDDYIRSPAKFADDILNGKI